VFIKLYSADIPVRVAALLPYVHFLSKSLIFPTTEKKTLASEGRDPNET